tara:strand:+ start:1339 stop:1995 length:657 start_codon:yes stop_codon:yes gene_type:complete
MPNNNTTKQAAPKTTAKKTVEKKAPKKKAAPKKKETAPAPAPAPVPVEPVTPVEAPVAVEAEQVSDTPYLDEFKAVVTTLDDAMATIKGLKSRIQKLEKQVHRDHRANIKKIRGKKRRVPDPNNPSGFNKPGPVSNELRKFLSLKKDELISRTDVTKSIHTYCKDKGLQDDKDKRILKPDAPLRKLLKMGKTDELTFFNLQKYMKVHYPNKDGTFPTA